MVRKESVNRCMASARLDALMMILARSGSKNGVMVVPVATFVLRTRQYILLDEVADGVRTQVSIRNHPGIHCS